MPRSGTWLCHYFFRIYDALLKNEQGIQLPIREFMPHDGMRMNLGIVHAVCPGFLAEYSGELRSRWDEIRFVDPGYDWASAILAANADLFFPSHNPDVRIVYLCRNPLDQCLSYLQHAFAHSSPTLRALASDGDERRPLRDFIFAGGLDSYIKQYFTFHVMAPLHPDKIRLVYYERLMADPKETFADILAFLGHEVSGAKPSAALDRALRLCSPKSLKIIQAMTGWGLAHDRAAKGDSHIRSGKTGRWRRHLRKQDLAAVDARLLEFGMSLRQFQVR